jgi:ribonuclease BN (tRNA processing enzyme)
MVKILIIIFYFLNSMICTILGSGTGLPSLDRASPGLMVEINNSKILCDTGPGTLRQLLKTHTTINDIDLIIYSHFHIDHTADMIPFFFASKYDSGKFRTKDIKIIGPNGIKKLFHDLCLAYGNWIIPEHLTIEWYETLENTTCFDDFVVKTTPVKHTDSSIAIRIEDNSGKSVVYSGDTDYCSEIIKLAYKTDLLILECSFPENMKCKGHLIPSLAGEVACESKCRKLVLTHFYPPCDSFDILSTVTKEFSGEVVLARDLMKIRV